VKVATGPCELWSWDITYLAGPVRGTFFYLYVVMDVWSRKIVGWQTHTTESSEHAAALIAAACTSEGIERDRLVLHSDNGAPMKGATMLATLQALGVVPSFSRPRVSNDNPYSESAFRTLKYRPGYPSLPFASIEAASKWVATFMGWYNNEHLHSGIRFVSPADRHSGRHHAVLEGRRTVYEAARRRNPERWSGSIRNLDPIETVILNPEPLEVPALHAA
jgi:putative transposase